jgi:WXG100 family type VII secretion target
MAQNLYDLDAMTTIANQLSDLVADWKTSTDTLYTTYDELDSMWDGDANDAFNAKFINEDKDKYNKLAQAMEEYVEVIRQAVETYRTAEEEVANIVK